MEKITKNIISFLILVNIIMFSTNIIFAEIEPATPSGVPLSKIEAEVDTFAKGQIGKTTPGMAIAVVQDGEIILLKGYGYADIKKQTPVDPKNTVFEYGSITKLLVWTSVMQLVEEGKLNLDDDIKNYLPKDFSDQLLYEYPITMYDLMHHTAGFEQKPFDWNPLDPKSVIVPLDINLIKHQPKQIYTPKEIIAYSNYGVCMAGFIVEQLTGQKFYDYVSENILAPANISKTSANPLLFDKPQLIDNKATGYMTTGNADFKKGIWSFLWQYPAGSANGTVEDLGKYLITLMPKTSKENKLFKQTNTLTQMLTQSYSPNKTMSSNAHGFWEHYDSGTSYWHPGNTASFSSFFAFNPNKNFGIAVLTNASFAYEPTYGLAKLLLGEEKTTESEQSVESVPIDYKLGGTYMYSMYSKEGYFKSASYLSNLVKIEEVDKKTIKVSSLGKTSTYVKISPYYYKLKETNSSELYFTQPQLYVEFENNIIKRLSSGHMMDIIPVASKIPIFYPWFSAVFYIMSLFFFSITFIVMIFVVNKKNHTERDIVLQDYFLMAFSGLGTMLVLNIAYIIYHLPLQVMGVLPNLNSFIIVNYIIVCLVILLFIYRIFIVRYLNSIPVQKTVNQLLSTFFIVLIFLLYSWKLLNI